MLTIDYIKRDFGITVKSIYIINLCSELTENTSVLCAGC